MEPANVNGLNLCNSTSTSLRKLKSLEVHTNFAVSFLEMGTSANCFNFQMNELLATGYWSFNLILLGLYDMR